MYTPGDTRKVKMNLHLKYNHWLPKRLGVGAITLWPYILFANKAVDVPQWLHDHELVHVSQIRNLGPLRFYTSYLLYYAAGRVGKLNHNQAYICIPYEIEAYKSTQP